MMAARTEFRVLLEGIAFPESPRWHDGRLWFSDWLAHQVIAVDQSGEAEVIAEVDAFPFSIDWLPDGPLMVTAGREVLRMDGDRALTQHADLSGLTDFGLNEIVIHERGFTYVNGAGFDLMGGGEPAPGLVTLVRPDGSSDVLDRGIAFPNGMAISPDGGTLVVADSYGKELVGFDIREDGSLSNRRTWAGLGDGVPDGICFDAQRAVWYADVPNRRCVRVAEGGEVLETVQHDRGCFACMLGGADGDTLFIAAQEWNGPEGIGSGPRTGQILQVDAPAPHAGRP